MRFLEYTFAPILSESISEILLAYLDELGYEGFVQDDQKLVAFISEDNMDEKALDDLLNNVLSFEGHIDYQSIEVPDINWNEQWEKDFHPIEIDGIVRIRASFHPEKPSFPYELIIDPKMSFGTGHHATTSLMIQAMLGLDFRDIQVLDMGCGTGLLGILASKMGAAAVLAADIDTWAVKNSRENALQNKCSELEILQGGIKDIKNKNFDIILANINRNVLMDSMEDYSRLIQKDGFLLLSGIIINDELLINSEAAKHGFLLSNKSLEKDWMSMLFIKE